MILIKQIKSEDTWIIRQTVMWPEKPIAFVKIEEDNQGIHFGLFKDDQLISIISCFENSNEIQFRKFATLQSWQNKGFGTLLLNHIIQRARNEGLKMVWCNARVDKKGYYEKFGLIETGHKFMKGGIEFTTMEVYL